ncbi:hypothetical protein JHK82_051021 [Glycine max]|nr:hypothetical protein JHK82_051021 [Glycine max]
MKKEKQKKSNYYFPSGALNQAPHHGGGGHDHDGLKSRLWVVLVPLSQNKKKRNHYYSSLQQEEQAKNIPIHFVAAISTQNSILPYPISNYLIQLHTYIPKGRARAREKLANIIGNLKEEWQRQAEQENIKREEVWMRRVEEEKQRTMDTFKGQIQEAIKLELSQIVSQHSAPLQPNDIQVLAAREAEKDVSSPLKTVEEEKAAEVIDPLGELVKNLFDIYQRPVESPKLQRESHLSMGLSGLKQRGTHQPSCDLQQILLQGNHFNEQMVESLGILN